MLLAYSITHLCLTRSSAERGTISGGFEAKSSGFMSLKIILHNALII